jgi:taurine dioxygenase
MKARLAGLRCLHVRESSRSPRKMAKLTPEEAVKQAQALQPIVAIHPLTGRKGLYLNTGRMESIPGMPDEEAHKLIAELMAHATRPEYEYRHKWRKNDVVIWDNLTVLHQANGDAPPEELRYLLRLMIKGQPLMAA